MNEFLITIAIEFVVLILLLLILDQLTLGKKGFTSKFFLGLGLAFLFVSVSAIYSILTTNPLVVITTSLALAILFLALHAATTRR